MDPHADAKIFFCAVILGTLGLVCFGALGPAWAKAVPLAPQTQTTIRSSTTSGKLNPGPSPPTVSPAPSRLRAHHDQKKDVTGATAISTKETSGSFNHPMVTRSPLPAALIFHTTLGGTTAASDPWVIPFPDRQSAHQLIEGSGGLSLIPYVSEGIPPATLRIDTITHVRQWGNSWGSLTAKTGDSSDGSSPTKPSATVEDRDGFELRNDPPLLRPARQQLRQTVVRGLIRMQMGLRDLNLSASRKGAHATQAVSLALPDGVLLAEVRAWKRGRIIKPEFFMGYHIIDHKGLEIDMLLPEHILLGYQHSKNFPKLYARGEDVSVYRVPLVDTLARPEDIRELIVAASATDATAGRDKEKDLSFPLERERRIQFVVGIQQRIFHVWHLNFEAGLARRKWTLYRSSGASQETRSTGFGPYASIGIESLVPSFIDRGRKS